MVGGAYDSSWDIKYQKFNQMIPFIKSQNFSNKISLICTFQYLLIKFKDLIQYHWKKNHAILQYFTKQDDNIEELHKKYHEIIICLTEIIENIINSKNEPEEDNNYGDSQPEYIYPNEQIILNSTILINEDLDITNIDSYTIKVPYNENNSLNDSTISELPVWNDTDTDKIFKYIKPEESYTYGISSSVGKKSVGKKSSRISKTSRSKSSRSKSVKKKQIVPLTAENVILFRKFNK